MRVPSQFQGRRRAPAILCNECREIMIKPAKHNRRRIRSRTQRTTFLPFFWMVILSVARRHSFRHLNMYIPQTYSAALIMMLVSMLCWGSWANTQKIDKTWRFELFYWDYMWGILLCSSVSVSPWDGRIRLLR